MVCANKHPYQMYVPKGFCPVKLSVITQCVYMHMKVECEMMCYIKQYTLEYILAEAYDAFHITVSGVLS